MPATDAGRVVELLGASPDAVLVCDSDLRWTFATGGLLGLLGYDPDDLVGRPVVDLLDPAHVAEAVGYLERLPNESFLGRAPARLGLRTADGGVRPAEILGATAPEGSSVFVLRDALETERNAESAGRLNAFESLLGRVFGSMMGARLDQLDEVVERMLADIGGFIGADVGFVGRLDTATSCLALTHLWRDEPNSRSGEPAIGRLDLTAADLDRLLAPQPIVVHDLLADATHASYRLDPDTRSVLLVPFSIGDTTGGVLCFATRARRIEWRSEDVTVLLVVASSIGLVLQRQADGIRAARTAAEIRATFEDVPVALGLLSADGTVVQANRPYRRVLGVGPDAHPNLTERVHPEDLDSVQAMWRQLLDGTHADAVAEFRLRTANDTWIWVRSHGRAQHDEHGRFTHCACTLESIDSGRRTQEALARSEARFGSLVENLPDAVFRVDTSLRVVFGNSAAQSLWFRMGVAASPDGRGLPDLLAVQLTSGLITAFRSSRIQVVDLELGTPDETAHLQAVLVPEGDAEGDVEQVLVVVRDMTEQRRFADELAYRASHDMLTDLPNRSRYLELLEAARGRMTSWNGEGERPRLAVLFFDLDRFKQVNDSLGHSVGDTLLTQVALRLRRAVRPQDVLARLGGDEFTVLMESVDEPAAMAVAERLLESLRDPIRLGDREILVAGSIGVVVEGDATVPASELLRRADTAMYHAKESGRSRVSLFDRGMIETVEHRLELDQRLRTVVARDELRLHFQPEVRLHDGTVLGAEALLRWKHPHRGLLPAGEFVGHAEETGMILAIGDWVLERSCEWAAAWVPLLGDREFVMRVNVSPWQLTGPDFVNRLSGLLAVTGLPPSRLCLEITESAFMPTATEAMEALSFIDRLGISIAVDDFGTGYSSLAYLKRLPVDVLKIDRSFVHGLPSDTDDAAIVSTIVHLAESLDMTPTAEGVETEEQRRTLIGMGVERGQGFLFSKPVPVDEFERRFLVPVVGSDVARPRPAAPSVLAVTPVRVSGPLTPDRAGGGRARRADDPA